MPDSPSATTQKASETTPMLKQYHSLKKAHQDCILFFRLGDFYEMFFEDAKIASKILDLVLTSRGKNTANHVPMCGFPHHSAEGYIAKLIESGHKVAICEQTEDPAATKGIVKREVTRIITSGTYLDEKSTDTRYLLTIAPGPKNIGITFIDPATGQLQTNQYALNLNHVAELITRLPIYECVYPQSQENFIAKVFQHPLLKTKNIALSPYDDWCFNPDMAQKSLCEHFKVANLHGFGLEELPLATASTGALLEYLKAMNKQPLEHIDRITLFVEDDYLYISPAAHRGLELSSLIKTLDHTLTPLGKRQFANWIYHPLKNIDRINERQLATETLKANKNILQKLKNTLNPITDIEKNISRLSCGYTHPKDLLAIRNVLIKIPELQMTINQLATKNPLFALDDIKALREHLDSAINEEMPLSNFEGKIIKPGYNQELDELRNIQETGRAWLKELQAKEIQQTGINSLKIGYNRVFGYYLEVTKIHARKVPDYFIRKQTLVNAERYITPELKEYEEKILTAQDKIQKIENHIVSELKNAILKHSLLLHKLSSQLATIDCIYSLSILAQSNNYCLPNISNDTLLDIRDGRHPVVEKTIAETFIANDTLLNCDDSHLIILTGPNMAGKSTYIRQTGILIIMAQAGCFLPAKSAHIGIVDKVFTRIGAHDDIARGQSTFMVEMNETADILNNLTERSLIILDEIGRGTSTYDGLSLAWSLAEYLKNTKTRTLFATHFHELTALGEKNSGVQNYNVAVKEWKDEIIFMHKIVPGSTDDSYGIYVAKLAGIPESVIKRARTILTDLENNVGVGLKSAPARNKQKDLFDKQIDPLLNEIKKELAKTDINNLTPIEALNKLKELKDQLSD